MRIDRQNFPNLDDGEKSDSEEWTEPYRIITNNRRSGIVIIGVPKRDKKESRTKRIL